MITFHLPAGPMNLQPLFPALDFSDIEEYYVQVRNQADNGIILTTPYYKRGCCCGSDSVRVFFVNYLGGIDAVNFKIIAEELETSSARWKKPIRAPMQKWDGGIQRYNVQSNETVTAENSCYSEQDQEWLKELLATPNAWIQWLGTQGQDNDYIPIVIRDGKFLTRKSEGRYSYVLQIQFDLSNENIILRN